MRLLPLVKALRHWLAMDLSELSRAARPVQPTLPAAIQAALLAETQASRSEFQLAKAAELPSRNWPTETGSQASDNPAIRLIEVLSALPPAQFPPWFTQRFAGEPLFELREFRELSPAQRRQVLVLVEKTLSARPVQAETPVKEDMHRFLQAARQV